MKNKIELHDTATGWIAVFSGETGEGNLVEAEEAHNIVGVSEKDRITNALLIWGADAEQTEVTVS